jgi:hypothetical protein
MVISSIEFSRVSYVSRTVTGVVDGSSTMVVANVVVVLTPVRGTALSGMTSMGTICSFSFNNLSNSASISLIWAFFSMINFNISSFWPSVSTIFLSSESFVAGNFNCFLNDAMSAFFFFRSS